ncbi:ABC transporter permease [Rhodospirillum rubrum]|uniref:Inner-membrane translocator n=1 Tax=Rhodospirillum rubrum (strain ATCC 11170 / ATH 1.1.1 / DSM 467 / LMG 4362 / NCIMB 8255 / S1) TaxID=269796 RepID=Q2RSJ0_RHORT|nr:ABC transporter permease [Rhodospirillum rubrum]ABC22905.1 inner-membrane translocator [Rhodospirillum rubrum ATCC 11170]AEO48629.1 inner-membrane translocator [Rhodospirillum rubrum F11]MBK5954510.1 ABC transporter permease [Rhodospirillum rubrum]QXG78892.1 ABC transporter permease [Rhodospirillum rubrum]HAQ00241.1 ABC transporter permease [Rhodospirillum rubrum]
MSLIAFLGAVESGLIFGLVALGVFLSFRILDFPDLTVDGSFPLGGAVSATLIVSGWDPFLATAIAIVAGAMAGAVTALLNVKLRILHLLASILTMIALYSVNLRIMGRPNVALLMEPTVFSLVEAPGMPSRSWMIPAVLLVVIVLALIAFNLFMASRAGLAMRATGANARMAGAQGVSTAGAIVLGMAMSNGLVALAGALFAQSQGGADVTMGVGVIVVGLASVIGGEAVMPTRTVLLASIACVIGAIMYRLAVALALNADSIGLQAQDLNLITAVLVAVAMVLPGSRASLRRNFRRVLGLGDGNGGGGARP